MCLSKTKNIKEQQRMRHNKKNQTLLSQQSLAYNTNTK